MSVEFSSELRDFIEAARSGADSEALEEAWIKAFGAAVKDETRMSVRRTILNEIEAFQHPGTASGWTPQQADVALDPRYSQAEAAAMLGWTVKKVERVRMVERPKRRTMLRELAEEMARGEGGE